MRTGILVVGVLALLGAGCDAVDRGRIDIQLQPDLSGRMTVAARIEKPLLGESHAESAAAQWLAKLEGVDAWSDVVAAVDSEGRTRLTAVGWFRDLRAIRHEGRDPFEVAVVNSAVAISYEDPVRAGFAKLGSREQLLKELGRPDDQELRVEAKRLRGLIYLTLASFESELSLTQVGHAPQEVQGFQREGATVRLRHDVDTIAALLDEHVAAVSALRKRVRAGELTPEKAADELLARRSPAPSVRWGPTHGAADPAFTAELERARAAWQTSEWKKRIERRARRGP